MNHPRFWQTQLYRSRRAERLGHALYALFTLALLVALAAGLSTLRQ